jgi:hypothetical protein
MLYRVHLARVRFELTTLVVIGTGSCKSNYHTITTTTIPYSKVNSTFYVLIIRTIVVVW